MPRLKGYFITFLRVLFILQLTDIDLPSAHSHISTSRWHT